MLAVIENKDSTLAEECRWLANTDPDCRFDMLESALVTLKYYVWDEELSADEVSSALLEAADRCGLISEIGADAVRSLIKSRLDNSRYSLRRDFGSTIRTESIIDPTDWQGAAAPPMQWAVDKTIPERNVTWVSGEGGVGKSLLGKQLLASTALGAPWLGLQTRKGKALGVFCEDDEDELHRRLVNIASHYGCQLADLVDVSLLSRVGEDNLLITFDKQDRGTPTQFYEDLTELAVYSGVRTILLDSLHDIFGGNEIIRFQVRQFIGYLRRLAIRIDGAVIFTGHPSLTGIASGTGTSGSTAWHNAVRSRLYLTRPHEEGADDGVRILKTMKQNYGPRGAGIELRWNEGVFVRTNATTGDPFREAEAAFLECLDKMREQGRFVSVSPNSSTFAPKMFCRMPQARSCSKDKLRRAMDALFNAGKIKVGHHRKANRHLIEVIERSEQ